MPDIFVAICVGNFKSVKQFVAWDSENVNIQNYDQRTPLDFAIVEGKLDIAQFLFEKGGRPNLDIYRDGKWTPVHWAAKSRSIETLNWVFAEGVLPLSTLNIKCSGWTPIDIAIAHGRLEIAQFLFEKGGRPNLKIHCDGEDTPVHHAARRGCTETLKWIFTEKILPLRVLQIKDDNGRTPLNCAIYQKEWRTASLIQRLPIDYVFLAMQRAKRDNHQCALRQLPDELLDMVVDEVATRFRLKVVW